VAFSAFFTHVIISQLGEIDELKMVLAVSVRIPLNLAEVQDLRQI
jgi:hypothetical protein